MYKIFLRGLHCRIPLIAGAYDIGNVGALIMLIVEWVFYTLTLLRRPEEGIASYSPEKPVAHNQGNCLSPIP